MTSNKQNVTMNQYKDIGKVCKPKPLKAEHQYYKPNDTGKYFKYPGEIVMWVNTRYYQPNKKQYDEYPDFSHYAICYFCSLNLFFPTYLYLTIPKELNMNSHVCNAWMNRQTKQPTTEWLNN